MKYFSFFFSLLLCICVLNILLFLMLPDTNKARIPHNEDMGVGIVEAVLSITVVPIVSLIATLLKFVVDIFYQRRTGLR